MYMALIQAWALLLQYIICSVPSSFSYHGTSWSITADCADAALIRLLQS